MEWSLFNEVSFLPVLVLSYRLSGVFSQSDTL